MSTNETEFGVPIVLQQNSLDRMVTKSTKRKLWPLGTSDLPDSTLYDKLLHSPSLSHQKHLSDFFPVQKSKRIPESRIKKRKREEFEESVSRDEEISRKHLIGSICDEHVCLTIPTTPKKTPSTSLTDRHEVLATPSKTRRMLYQSPLRGQADIDFRSPEKFNLKPTDTKQFAKSLSFSRYSSSRLIDKQPILQLPPSYERLRELFKHIDQLVSMLYNRQVTATFKKLRESVERVTHKRFDQSQLAQIIAVYPEAFTLEQRNIQLSNRLGADYELVIIPNFKDDLIAGGIEFEKCNNSASPELASPVLKCVDDVPLSPREGRIPLSPRKDGAPMLAPAHFQARLQEFTSRLYSSVADYHKKFLASVNPLLDTTELDSNEKLYKWHPKFDLNTVPEIQPAVLPVAPTVDRLSSVSDVLEKSKKFGSILPSKMEKAIRAHQGTTGLANDKSTECEDQILATADPQKCFSKTRLKGISPALLEKVIARQAQNDRQAMFCPALDEMKRIRELPEFVRTLQSVFTATNKTVLPEAKLIKLISQSTGLTDEKIIQSRLHLLAEKVPSVQLMQVKLGSFVKIGCHYAEILNKLNGIITELGYI